MLLDLIGQTSDARLRGSSIDFFRSSGGRKSMRGHVWPLQDCDYGHRPTPMATRSVQIVEEMNSVDGDEHVSVFLGG